jgi:antitoxin (DNA-binding transcriptional repressor) of toxin-antitoxin stability system
MQSISCAEAQQRLPEFMKRALAGEEIRIEADGRTVRLQPVVPTHAAKKTPREALLSLQAHPQFTAEEASKICQTIREEREAWKR